jgi:hypothetical protein
MGNFMRSAVLISAAAFGPAALAPAAAAQDVSLPLRVRTGDQFTVSITERSALKMGEQEQTAQATSVWSLDVLTGGAANGRWRWTPVTISIDEVSGMGLPEGEHAPRIDFASLSEGVGALMRLGADIGFECQVDRAGRCAALSNWPVWAARIENTALLFEAFARFGMNAQPAAVTARQRKEAFAAGLPPPTTGRAPGAEMWDQYRQPALAGIAAMIDGIDERAAGSAFAGLYPLYGVQGRTLTVGRETPFTEEWTLPYGAPPLRMSGAVTVTSFSPSDGVVTFTRTATLDEESLKTAARIAFAYVFEHVILPVQQAGDDSGIPDLTAMRAMAESTIDMFTFSLSEETQGTMDLRTGLARETTSTYTWTVSMDQNGLLGAMGMMGPEMEEVPAAPEDAPAEGEEASPGEGMEAPAEEVDAPAAEAEAPAAEDADAGPRTLFEGASTITLSVNRGRPSPPRLPRARTGG